MRFWPILVLACLLAVPAVQGDARDFVRPAANANAGPQAPPRQVPSQTAPAPEIPDVDAFVARLTEALQREDAEAYRALFVPAADGATVDAAVSSMLVARATRVVVLLRDRTATAAGARLLLEVFYEIGRRGRIVTLRADVVPGPEAGAWLLASQEVLTTIDGLYRLELDPSVQYRVRDLEVRDNDLTLSMESGDAFMVNTDAGTTAVVLIGSGRLRFSPPSGAERAQVRIFSGREVLETPIDAAFVRFSPSDFASRIPAGALTPVEVDQRQFQRARQVFAVEVGKSFTLGLADVSDAVWSILPPYGDFLAEIRTRRYSTLTYAHSGNDAEDISLFDRRKRRNISVYSSERALKARGRFYNEDDFADYDVLDYDVDAVFDPARETLSARTRVRLRMKSFAAANLTFRLAEPLALRSVHSERFGRVLALRVRNQNSVLVSLPQTVQRGEVLELTFTYGGILPSQTADREVVDLEQTAFLGPDVPELEPEPRVMYSNRSYWYPQAPVSDYATATLRLTLPPGFSAVASGAPAPDNPAALPPGPSGDRNRSLWVFRAGQPIRYLTVLLSRLEAGPTATLQRPVERPTAAAGSSDDGRREGAPAASGVFYDSLEMSVVGNPRQIGRGRQWLERSADVFSVYLDILRDVPYPTFTLALVDAQLPGGHSPGYFVLLNQPLPGSPYVWRNDPVYFDSFPQFFLAHELAHQFWGQAVGWKSYHEQWISEGFAQYFAALYAERRLDAGALVDIFKQMRRSAMREADEGPIHLGYRLGHIKADSRVFRSVVYNKGALVLHMLRRLLGDDVFFEGLRRFYMESRFRKAGTDDLQRVMQEVSGRDLGRFFERWVLEAALPRLVVRHTVRPAAGGGEEAVITVEQQQEAVFDVPVQVTLRFRSGARESVVVPVTAARVEHVVALREPLSGISANDDHGTLGDVTTK